MCVRVCVRVRVHIIHFMPHTPYSDHTMSNVLYIGRNRIQEVNWERKTKQVLISNAINVC